MENFTSDSGSRSQSCPFNRLNEWEEDSIPDSVRLNTIACVLVNSISSPVITAANVLVCWSVFNNQTLRRNHFKLLLAFLALTDLLMGAVGQPLYVVTRIYRLSSKRALCELNYLRDMVSITLGTVSYYHVVVLSGERYLAIQHALRYKALVTSEKLMCVVAVTWLISLLTAFGFVFISNETWTSASISLPIVSCFFLVYCNICVLIESKRHHRAIVAQVIPLPNQENAPQSVSTASNQASRSEEFKAVKTTALIVGVFLLTFVLVVVINIPVINLRDSLPSTSVHITLEWTGSFIRLISLVNPLVYCWRVSEIRRVCYDNLRKIFRKNGQ